ncbi:sensor domain-containing diguanylate cyclase [Azohydromonas australica]|uniref:sensor domain-containing diguanylate cyclase n=1 Tax=Azohydromonas australica TaxID=364039 RepID=UPI00042A2429|nr:diguanylate cyclase [Azohydromonas australica]
MIRRLSALLGEWLRSGRGSLRLRMTLAGVAALTLGICLTTLLLVQRAERDTLRDQREREVQEAARTAAVLSSRVVELQNLLRIAGEQLTPATLQDPPALARFMHERAVLRAQFSHVAVMSPDGHVRMYAEREGVRPLDLDIGQQPYFRQTVAEGRPIVSEVLTSRVIGEPVVVLTYPLHGPQGLYGVIGGAVRLGSGDLVTHAAQYLDLEGRDALLVVSDTQGRILAHPDPRRTMTRMADDPQLAGVWNGWQLQRGPLEPSGVSVEQPGLIASVAAVTGPDWLLWRLQPEEQLLRPLHAARSRALVDVLVMVLVTSLVLLALVGRLLRPMRVLERRAQSLFDAGQDLHSGWPACGGEVGRLAQVLREVGSERAALEAANAALLERLESVMAAAPVGIALTRQGRFELVNAELCRLLGREPGELQGRPMALAGLECEPHRALLQAVEQAFAAGESYRGEWQLQRADGERFWAVLNARQERAGDAASGVIWTVSDHSAQVAAREQLEWSARHDPLTRLSNRIELERRLAQVFAARSAAMPAALVAIDLDRFKPINDSAGHAAGDAMLQLVAEALLGCVRRSDLAVRLGGDEFVLLLERCEAEQALEIAHRVCAAVNRLELHWEGHRLHVGASAGVAMLEDAMTQPHYWMRAADHACYAAKRHGRGHARLARRGAAVAA